MSLRDELKNSLKFRIEAAWGMGYEAEDDFTLDRLVEFIIALLQTPAVVEEAKAEAPRAPSPEKT